MRPRIKAKPPQRRIPRLLLQHTIIHRPPINPRRRPSLQPVRLKPQPHQAPRQRRTRPLPRPPRPQRPLPHPYLPIHKRPRRQHHRLGPITQPKVRRHPRHPPIPIHQHIRHHPLPHIQILLTLQHPTHIPTILQLIRLRPQRPHRRTLTHIQHPLLQITRIRRPPNLAPQRIHLVHQLRLRRTPHRRITRLPRNLIQRHRQQQRLRTQPSGRQRGLHPRMPSTDHHDVVRLVVVIDIVVILRERRADDRCLIGVCAGSRPPAASLSSASRITDRFPSGSGTLYPARPRPRPAPAPSTSPRRAL